MPSSYYNYSNGITTGYTVNATDTSSVAYHNARVAEWYRQQQAAIQLHNSYNQQLSRAREQWEALRIEKEEAIKNDPSYSHPNFKVIQKIRAMQKKRQEKGYVF